MHIYIKTLGGTTHDIEIEPSNTIEDVKLLLMEVTGIHKDR